ncbi:MAG: NB-ARC domain-containing protein, partial [Chloroflexota bacterium]
MHTKTELPNYRNLLNYLNRYNSLKEPLPTTLINLQLVQIQLAADVFSSDVERQNALNRVIGNCIDLLENRYPEQADLLTRRFIYEQPESIRDIARQNSGETDLKDPEFTKEQARLNQLQKQAITELLIILLAEEKKATEQHKSQMAQRLGGASYDLLVGTDRLENELIDLLKPDSDKHIVVLTGQGGIGKTSLADKVIRQAIQQLPLDTFLRVDATGGVITPKFLSERLYFNLFGKPLEGQTLHEIEQKLILSFTHRPLLVFIDGVEDKLNPLLDKLRQYTGRTKFLITSRERPSNYAQLSWKEVPSLTKIDGLHLLSHTLNQVHINQSEPIEVPADQFNQVFDKVGGNPLALKLIATLTQEMSLAQVLGDLRTVDHKDTKELYKRVYERVWNMLDQPSRQIM